MCTWGSMGPLDRKSNPLLLLSGRPSPLQYSMYSINLVGDPGDKLLAVHYFNLH